ncbi:TetR/AcrR family transcriptional regulator [Roseibium sp.]|uniref:TetR/AcrR family transcriptional regulator n=1 Tax=Roseibium sp. TaxID=1936156 RepID=UPI003D106162
MAKDQIRKKTAYHHGDLRDQLVAAASNLIDKHGHDGFSMSDACRLAGVSTAAPYRHFASRQALLAAVAEQGLQRLGEAMERAASKHPRGTLDSIAAVMRTFVDFARREPNIFRLIYNTMTHSGRIRELETIGKASYGVHLREVALYLGEQEVNDRVVRTIFRLWPHVLGLSFLAMDSKLEDAEFPVDLDETIRFVAERLLPPREAAQKP